MNTNLPASGESCRVIYFYKDSTARLYGGFLNSTGTKKVFMNGDTGLVSANFTYEADVWYCLEMLYDSDTDDYGLWVDGTRYLTNNTVTTNDINKTVIGSVSGAYTNIDYDADCIVVADAAIGVEDSGVNIPVIMHHYKMMRR
jgi:hypothetical protein